MRIGWLRGVLVLMTVCLAGCAHPIPRRYAGRWLLRSADQNMMLLTTRVRGRELVGELTGPQHFTEQGDGSFADARLPILTRPLAGRRRGKAIEAAVGAAPDSDTMRVTSPDGQHLLLDGFHGVVPPWRFQRVQAGEHVVLKTDWPRAVVDPEIVQLQGRLRAAAEADQAVRVPGHFDDEAMGRLAAEALPLLDEIFAAYGWPAVTAFGGRAADDFWLLVQHQEQATQQRMIGSLRAAVAAGEASERNYAFLFDRVQIGEGKPQHWGTQSRCEHGHAVLSPLDGDVGAVDVRRKAIGLSPLTGHESEALCQQVR